MSEFEKDFLLLKEAFAIPDKPESLARESWLRYGVVGNKPRTFADLTADHVKKVEQGALSLFTQLAVIYHNENTANKSDVKKLFLQCIQAILKKNYSKGGTTYLVSRTRVEATTLYMSTVLKEVGLYDEFIKKWLIEERFLNDENPILNMDWCRDRLPMCWAFVSNMDDSREKLVLLKKLQLASSKVLERLITPDGGAMHHNCDHISYGSYSITPIIDLALKLHATNFRLSPKVIENLKAFARVRAYASINLYTPGNLSARATLDGFHFKSLPNILLSLHSIVKIENSQNLEMLDLFLALKGRHQGWKKDWLNKGFKEGELSGHISLNIASAAIHRRNDWVVSIDGNRAPFKGIEMYTSPGSVRSFMRNSCMGSIQIIKRAFQGKESGYVNAGWDHNHYPGVTAKVFPLHDLMTRRETEQIRNSSNFAQGTSLEQNGMWAMIVKGKEELCRKSVYCFDNRITVLTTGIRIDDTAPVHTTLFQYDLEETGQLTQIGKRKISQFPFKSSASLHKPILLKDHMENTYYVHPSLHSSLQVSRSRQKSYDLKLKTKSIAREKAADLIKKTKPQTGTFVKAYVAHKKNHSSLAYTIFVDGIKTKSLPYKIVEIKNDIHIFYDRLSKTSCYTFFDKDYQNKVGFIHSANRPITAMIQSEGDRLKCSITATDKLYDEYLQGKIKEFPELEPLVLTFNGYYRLYPQEKSEISCIHQHGKTIVTNSYKS